MAQENWTWEQEKAIEIKDRNLLVSAAAGAGKTAVLVERIIRRLTDSGEPVDGDRLLVVTFTNAAAQEMKERIGTALARLQTERPHDPLLERQLLLLGKAPICTLHSFCLEIIRQNFHELVLPEGLALDPRFRVAEEIETTLLKIETLEGLFEERYSVEDPLFLALVESFGGQRDDKALGDLVLKIYEFSRSQPHPEAWLREMAGVFQAEAEDLRVQKLLAHLAESIILPLEDALWRLRQAHDLATAPGGPQVYLPNLGEEIGSLERLLQNESPSWPELVSGLGEVRFASLKPCRQEVDEQVKKTVTALRNEVKKIVAGLKEEFLSRTPQEMLEDMKAMAPLMEHLGHVVEDFSLLFFKAKLEKNIIDFNDIEHLALGLLGRAEQGAFRPAPLAERLRRHFVEVLVDEYQDINQVQEAILTLVSRQDGDNPNMFMVGDVKQSIYGFRLADPGLFLQKYLNYDQDQQSREVKVILSRNFRSRQNIINAANYIFRQIMTTRLGQIAYDAAAELAFGAGYPPATGEEDPPEPAVELHILDRKGEGDPLPEEINWEEEEGVPAGEAEEPDNLQMEARLLGKRILELMGTKVWDRNKGEYRDIRYRDIVVLLRSTKDSVQAYLDEFRLLGIPAYAETGSGYFAAQEVQVMVSLLKVIDNPRQDIPLTAVLCSPVVGLTARELALLGLHRRGGDFYDAVRLAARRERGGISAKLKGFLDKLRNWRTWARRSALSELIWLLYQETHFYDYVGAMPGGRQRQANLRALYDRARQYENTAMKGLFKFLRFLEKLEDTDKDLGTARALGEKEDVVRVMSIHKSKGLEFPVVFLAGLGRSFNLRGLYDDLLIDRELGLGPQWVDAEQRLKMPTLAKLAVKNKLKKDLLAEEIRILYVAMTRARERLILVGSVRDLGSKLEKWSMPVQEAERKLPPGLLSRAGCFLDWLGPALLRHREGQVLWQLAGREGTPAWGSSLVEDPSDWRFYLWTPGDLKETAGSPRGEYIPELEKVRRLLALDVPEGEGEQVARLLDWQYPYGNLASIPAKMSVSEIKNRYRFLAQDQLSEQVYSHFRQYGRRPRFLQERHGLTASEKGSALHLVMRHLDLAGDLSASGIRMQAAGLVGRDIITWEQADSIDPEKITTLILSPFGERMRRARPLLRELPFTLALPVKELYPHLGGENQEFIIVQGSLDCLWEEEGGLILVDYKTDLVTPETRDHLKERYRVQLELYSRAAQNIYGKPVKEKIIYSFQLNQGLWL